MHRCQLSQALQHAAELKYHRLSESIPLHSNANERTDRCTTHCTTVGIALGVESIAGPHSFPAR